MATASAPRQGFIARSKTYVLDVKAELGKVTWPTQADLKASTTVVLWFLVILAVMIGIMDIVFQRVVLALFRLI